MKKIIAILAVALMIVAGLVWMKTRTSTAMQSTRNFRIVSMSSPIIEDAVVWAATKSWLERLSAGDSDPATAAFTARQTKYSADLLAIFAGDRDKLYKAEYAAFTDSGESAKWRIKEIGLPMETLNFLVGYREMLFSRLRSQLRDPNSLWSFYQEKKPVILNELKARPELRVKVLESLGVARDSFSFVAGGQAAAPIVVPNYVTFFAVRRMNEGGKELVLMYAKISRDLYAGM